MNLLKFNSGVLKHTRLVYTTPNSGIPLESLKVAPKYNWLEFLELKSTKYKV